MEDMAEEATGVTSTRRRTGCPSSDGFNKKAGKRANKIGYVLKVCFHYLCETNYEHTSREQFGKVLLRSHLAGTEGPNSRL